MKFLNAAILSIVMAGAVAAPIVAADTGSALVEAGSGSAVTPAPAPADSLANPATDPVEAYSDLKAAKRLGWPAFVFALAVMLSLAIGTVGRSIKQLAWLAKGRYAVAVAGTLAVGTAAYNAAAEGGALLAIGTAAVLAAASYWNSQRAVA